MRPVMVGASKWLAGAAAVAALAAFGCSSAEEPTAEPHPSRQRHAHIQVAVEFDGVRFQVSSHTRFLSYGVSRELAETLAAVPAGPDAPGSCALVDPQAQLDAALALVGTSTEPLVSLLDAGEVGVQIAGIATETLVPAHVPSLFPHVGGVEYGELAYDAPVIVGLPEAADVAVTGFGGAGVGPFDVVATLPPLPAQVETRLGADLLVTWAPAPPHVAEQTAMFVSIGAVGGASLRCRVRDDGRAVIAGELLESVSGQAPGRIVVERRRRVPFAARGLQWGELEVAARYVVSASAL